MSFEDAIRRRGAGEYADFVLASIREDDRVLDVGCGSGSITLGLAKAAGHVTGVDVADADEGFDDARAYAAEHGIDNVEFRDGSIYELDFPDASFDVCTLISMLETLDDPLAGLAEVHRVLRTGALLGASSIEYGGLVLVPTSRSCAASTSCGSRSGTRKATCIRTAAVSFGPS
jgi:ubiquinone/menaquinone biosynthesis C-methylase UbiE